MKAKSRIAPRLLLGAALLVGCGAITPAQADIFSVKPDKERRIGQDAAAQIERGLPVVSGPVADWVQSVGAKLAAASDKEFEYSFHVIDSPEINAFCLPGGHIYVYTGLRKIVQNDDELAAVLAHEITHAEKHHYAKQSSKASKRGTLLGIGSILLGLPALATQALGILDFSMQQKYSREHEYEADKEGFMRMQRAGYNPRAMENVLERLAKEDELKSVDRWFASHPDGDKRLEAVKKMSAEAAK